MSTNYYLIKPFEPIDLNINTNNIPYVIKEIQRLKSSLSLYIGMTNRGWVFIIHTIPDLGLNTFNDWLPLLQDPNNLILNELDKVISYEDFMSMIKNSSTGRRYVGEDITQDPYELCDLSPINFG